MEPIVPNDQQQINQRTNQQGADAVLPPLAGDASPVTQSVPVDPVLAALSTSTSQGQSLSPQKNSQHSPLIADDVDLIEKEWVVKAKAIIQKTRDNPNTQSEEIGKFKADYLKTRYGKDLKVSEN